MKFLNLKKLLKIFSINLVFLFIFSEVGSRFLLNYKKRNNLLSSSQLLKEYLNYVNHFRDNNIREKHLKKYNNNKKDLPLNFDDESIFIFDLISNCKNTNLVSYNEKCPTIMLQGDSWAEGLAQQAKNELFNNIEYKDWNIINSGNSSFSIANYSGQLAYFYKKNIKPKIIIINIDQSDFGDDYLRYKNNIKFKKNPIPHLSVKPFSYNTHRSFYNYYPYYPFDEISSEFSFKPQSIVLLKTFLKIFTNKLKYKTNKRLDFTSTLSWAQKASILVKYDPKAVEYVKDILKKYLTTAKEIGVEEIHIFTHPHYRHIFKGNSDEESYTYSISSLVEEVIIEEKINLVDKNFKVYHEIFPISEKNCFDKTCSGHYLLNDKASHLTSEGYKKYASFINEIFLRNSKFK